MVQHNNLAYRMYLKKTQAVRRNISVEKPLPKQKSQKDTANPGNNLYHTNSLIYQIKPNTFKLPKHMNKDITESENINSGASKNHFYIITRNYGKITLLKKIIEMQKSL